MQTVYFPLVVTADGSTPFPPVQNLIGDAEILGLVAYDASIAAFTPAGAAVVSAADALALTVTVNSGSDQLIQQVPYMDLARSANGGLWYETVPFVIDLTKCFIRTNAAITAGSNAAVTFIYRKL